MANLLELQAKLNEAKARAERDVEDAPPNIRTGLISKRNAAREEVVAIARGLRQTILKSAAAVFVGGDRDAAVSFADGIEEEANGVVVYADAVYFKLASDIWPTMAGGMFTASNLPIFATALQSFADECGLPQRVNPSVMGDRVGRTYKSVGEFAADLRTAIRSAVETELEVQYTNISVIASVLNGYEQNVVPVVVLGAENNDPLMKNLFDGDCFYVEAVKDDEQKQVKSALKTLKEIFKAKLKSKRN